MEQYTFLKGDLVSKDGKEYEIVSILQVEENVKMYYCKDMSSREIEAFYQDEISIVLF